MTHRGSRNSSGGASRCVEKPPQNRSCRHLNLGHLPAVPTPPEHHPHLESKDAATVPAAKKTAPAAKNAKKKEYGAAAITVLEGLEAVRKLPGMYIGSTGERGLHHLVWEVVDNAVDEAMAGYATKVGVRILDDGGVEVRDDGRGVPLRCMQRRADRRRRDDPAPRRRKLRRREQRLHCRRRRPRRRVSTRLRWISHATATSGSSQRPRHARHYQAGRCHQEDRNDRQILGRPRFRL